MLSRGAGVKATPGQHLREWMALRETQWLVSIPPQGRNYDTSPSSLLTPTASSSVGTATSS